MLCNNNMQVSCTKHFKGLLCIQNFIQDDNSGYVTCSRSKRSRISPFHAYNTLGLHTCRNDGYSCWENMGHPSCFHCTPIEFNIITSKARYSACCLPYGTVKEVHKTIECMFCVAPLNTVDLLHCHVSRATRFPTIFPIRILFLVPDGCDYDIISKECNDSLSLPSLWRWLTHFSFTHNRAYDKKGRHLT